AIPMPRSHGTIVRAPPGHTWEALRSAGPSRARRPSADADPRRDDRGGALSERHGASRSGSRARSLSRPAHEKEPDRERDSGKPPQPSANPISLWMIGASNP